MTFVELSAAHWVALVGSAFLVGLTKAGFGAGATILAVPLMVVALGGSEEMLPIMLPVLICGDIFSVIHYPGQKGWRNLGMLVPSCLVGIGMGSVALFLLETRAKERVGTVLDWLVAGICLAFLAIQVWRYFREWRLTQRSEPYRPRVWHGLAVGTLAGITSTLAHSAGPLIALFLLPQKLDRRLYVGTAVTYFLFGNAAKAPGYWLLHFFTPARLWTSAVLLPAVVVGTLLGVMLHRNFSGRYFVPFIYACTVAAVVKMLFL